MTLLKRLSLAVLLIAIVPLEPATMPGRVVIHGGDEVGRARRLGDAVHQVGHDVIGTAGDLVVGGQHRQQASQRFEGQAGGGLAARA